MGFFAQCYHHRVSVSLVQRLTGGAMKGMSMAKRKTKVHRSAITGRFVKESTAKRNPKTTVTETVPKKGRSKK